LTVLILLPLLSVGQNYFQQRVEYKISVKLDDTKNTLSAFEEILYKNNSTDTLSFIYFHLWPNGYSNTSTPMAIQMERSNNLKFLNAPDSSHGYIDGIDFKVDNKLAKWSYLKDTNDICILYLNEKLLPGKSINITTPFYVKVPGDDFSRLGHYGQSYQITQWYPKPAVYDKYGWHYFSYLNQGEFYSEFGKFEVNITLPQNYTVAATGVLQNPEEILRINEIAQNTRNINTFNNSENSFPVSSKKYKTIQFIQDSIHDFAWFADKRFHILKSNVVLPNSNKNVTTWVYFTNIEGNLWKNAINYVDSAIYYYSKWVGDYPYSNCSAVESALGAGGGMEYPMITNIGWGGNAAALENVIVHEVGHNWFYGILGNNERDNPWLDEGINSFYDQRYTSEIKKSNGIDYMNYLNKILGFTPDFKIDFNKIACDYVAGIGSDQPLNKASEEYLPENYGLVCYMKGALTMKYLKNYIGEKDFDKAMQYYYNKWQFKHPYPDDLEKVLEESTNKNLDWLFNDISNNCNYSDYKIKGFKLNKDSQQCEIIIRNKGKLDAPLNYCLYNDNKIIESKWTEGFTGSKSFTFNNINCDKVLIDPNNLIFEKKRSNNYSRLNGVLKKAEPIQIKLLGIIENSTRTQLCYTPVLGWNTSDGLMPGILLYNSFLPERKIQYRFMPMYGTNSDKLTGIAYYEYNFHPGILNIQKLNLFEEFTTFNTGKEDELSTWRKTEVGINVLFKRNAVFPLQQWQASIKATYATDYYADSLYNLFLKASVVYKDHSKRIPISAEFNAESGPNYLKAYTDLSWRINYNGRKTGFSARFFGGTFIYNNSNYGIYNFRISGTQSDKDYLYSEVFPDRTGSTSSKNLWSQQFVKNDGGFGIYSPIQTNKWMAALNLEAAFPVPLPLSLYFNVANYKNAKTAWEGSTRFPYEIGIEFKVIPDIFVIYFPVKMSKDVKSSNELYTNEYVEKIRFTLRLSKLVPFKYTSTLPIMF
jgi:hypothetical protein